MFTSTVRGIDNDLLSTNVEDTIPNFSCTVYTAEVKLTVAATVCEKTLQSKWILTLVSYSRQSVNIFQIMHTVGPPGLFLRSHVTGNNCSSYLNNNTHNN